MPIAKFVFVQNRIAHTCEEIGLLVLRPAKVPVLYQLEKNLMDHILGPASFAGHGRGKQDKCRAVLAIQDLDLIDIPLDLVHAGLNGKTIERARFVCDIFRDSGKKCEQSEDLT